MSLLPSKVLKGLTSPTARTIMKISTQRDKRLLKGTPLVGVRAPKLLSIDLMLISPDDIFCKVQPKVGGWPAGENARQAWEGIKHGGGLGGTISLQGGQYLSEQETQIKPTAFCNGKLKLKTCYVLFAVF